MTTMKVSEANRDALADIARDLGGVTLDKALQALLFEHETQAAWSRLEANPQALTEYRSEATELAEVDVAAHG